MLYFNHTLKTPYEIGFYTKILTGVSLLLNWYMCHEVKKTEKELQEIETNKSAAWAVFFTYLIGIAFLAWFAFKEHKFFY